MTVGIGIVGIGFMGTTHFRAAQQLRDAKVVAIATRDRAKWSGDWRGIQGNFGGGGGVHDLSDVAKYPSLEMMLEDPNVDLVDLCVPTHLHRDMAIAALKAGKHVLVEKPIALTAEDAEEMVETAKAAGKGLYVAQVLRFMSEFQLLKKMVDGGGHGRVVGLHLKRMVAQPDWGEGVSDFSVSGGPIMDLLIHDADFVQYLFGMPDRVSASGYRDADGHPIYYSVNFFYGQGKPAVSVTGGVAGMPHRPFEQGYDAYFERAFLQFNSSMQAQPRLITADGQEQTLPLPDADPFVGQLQYVVDSVLGKETGEILLAPSAARSLSLCLAAKESIETGRPVEV